MALISFITGTLLPIPFFLFFYYHYRYKPITRIDTSVPFRSAPLPVDVRTTGGYVGVGHAGNAIDLFRFRGENRRWREQSVDALLRNPEPFVVGERVLRLSR